ncbi:MAG: ribonuclease J [Clostridia bacterium]|nr:ribonuclease J [Clostridia bacterium]
MKKNNSLKIRFFGGVGEVGKNMTAFEYGNDIIVVDAGLSFPTEDMPGVDLLIPDTTYLEENKHKIKGYIVTHGHEDHIGALSYVLKSANAPVFGTRLTLTLIENKLKEHNLSSVSLNAVRAGSTLKLGCFNIEFINVNHSIAGAVALAITTPVGVLFHTGDFKIDYTPVAGEYTDLSRIAEIGKKGVLLMLSESTNVEREGYTVSETVVGETLDKVFNANATKRLIIATFASNVHRLQQILDLAVKYKRKVAFSGRSMVSVVESAKRIGELYVPANLIIDIDKIKNYKPEQILIVSTGTQGEPMSALTRMATGDFNKVTICETDTIIMSSSVIPGNEKMIYNVINNLYKKGADVLYETLEPIHVSGHACQEELKIMLSLIKPKFFIPIHGEYRHLKKHAILANTMGVSENNILIPEIGSTVEVTAKSLKFGENFKAGTRLVDGLEIDGSDSVVLRDRIHISEDGIVVVVVCVDMLSGKIVSTEIIGRGITVGEDTMAEVKSILSKALDGFDLRSDDGRSAKSQIRRSMKNYVFKKTKKNPMILPIIMEV